MSTGVSLEGVFAKDALFPGLYSPAIGSNIPMRLMLFKVLNLALMLLCLF